MNYEHKTVIHQREFVSRTVIHTNCIESFWGNLKIKLKAKRGLQGAMLDAFIDKYLYRFNRKSEGNLFELILRDIDRYYPV